MTYKLSPIGSFPHSENLNLMSQYRALVATRYQPCGHTQIKDLIKSNDLLISRKYDGELWFAINDDAPILVAPNGRTLQGTHPILDSVKTLPFGTILAGELYVPNAEGRERVGDVSKALSNKGTGLTFAVFDLVSDGQTTFHEMPYIKRSEHLSTTVKRSENFHLVDLTPVKSIAELEKVFVDQILAKGLEGLIVRSDDGRGFKVKAERSVDAVVIGFTEKEGSSGSLEVRSLLLGLTQGEEIILVGVAGNISSEMDRLELHSLLKTIVCPSDYRHAASTGQVYQMVKPQVIVEVKVVDIQVTDSKGLAMKQPVLQFLKDAYSVHKPIEAVTLINALAVRVRDDKQIEADGASWRQVEDVAPVINPESGDLPKSEVIKRQVWTKGSDGKVDVRKLVVWKTNKESMDPLFPAYVVHWTDYSKTRKSPLDREVKPAPNEKVALAIADSMIEENIKKGWTENV